MELTRKLKVFVGCYGAADVPTIMALSFDSQTGELTETDAFSGVANASYLMPHPSGGSLFAVSELGMGGDGQQGALWALALVDGGGFRPNLSQSTQGDHPCHIALDRSGRWAVASNYSSGSATLFAISAEGALSPHHAVVQHSGAGPNLERQAGPHAHSATFTPDNRYLLVADLGIDQTVIYRFDAATGTLEKQGAANAQPGAGPRHLAWHHGGHTLYVANELASSVSRYRYDAQAGTLDHVQTLSTLPAPDLASAVADIHLSPTGNHLYVSNRGHDSIAIFEVGDGGQLNSLGTASCGGRWPRNFAVAPDGRFMLVANQFSNDVAVLPISADGRKIGQAVAHYTIPTPSCVQFMHAA